MFKKQTGRPGEKSAVRERNDGAINRSNRVISAFGQSFLEGIHSVVDTKSDL